MPIPERISVITRRRSIQQMKRQRADMFRATLSYLKRIPGDMDLNPLLSSAKKEFETFEDVLTKTKKHLQQVDTDLETLVGVRTRAINKQLMSVGEDSTAQIGTEE